MNSLRIAHLSDLHFSKISLNPTQFFSKQWVGNLNLLVFRKKACNSRHIWQLIPLFKALEVEAVCITGDFVTTALQQEFLESQRFITEIEKLAPSFFVPGNHDYYTKSSELHHHFYQYLKKSNRSYDRIESHKIDANWWWVGLDTAIATPLFSSHGSFLPELEDKLETTLQRIPNQESVIIGNHFPLFCTQKPRHDLHNAEKLQKILKRHPNVKIYLHGHDHLPYIIDRQSEGYPLCLNSGSASLMHQGFFNILELKKETCSVSSYQFENDAWLLKKRETHFLKK